MEGGTLSVALLFFPSKQFKYNVSLATVFLYSDRESIHFCCRKNEILLRSNHNLDVLVLCIVLNTVQLDCSLLVLRGLDSNSNKEGAQLSG